MSSSKAISRGWRARIAAAGIAAIATLLGSLALATPALASTAGDLAAATNASRAANGLPALAENGSLDAVAQAWAQQLAAAGALSHNPNLRTQVSGWSNLGENVGLGESVASLEQAFMNSPEHRANILNAKYTQVGVGAATSTYAACGCQVMWVVVDFRTPTGAAAPAPAKAAPAKPAPAKAAAAKAAPAAPAPPATHAAAPVTHAAAPVTHAAAPAVHAASTTPPPATVPSAASTPQADPSAQSAGTDSAASPSATATALSASLAASAAGGNDPVSRTLDFATALAGLHG